MYTLRTIQFEGTKSQHLSPANNGCSHKDHAFEAAQNHANASGKSVVVQRVNYSKKTYTTIFTARPTA